MFALNDLQNLLFFDVETVYGEQDYDALSPVMQKQWEKRARKQLEAGGEDASPAKLYYEQAAIHAEFGRVVCISVGILLPPSDNGGVPGFRVKSMYGRGESKVLQNFAGLLNQSKTPNRLCGHNIKGFDVPYLCRRMLINGLPLPDTLNITGKKPWEVNMLDTMELWRFGEFGKWVSLELLTEVFGLNTPKDALDGQHVSTVFWEDKDDEGLQRIANYCERDVIATAQVLLSMSGLPVFTEQDVERASE